MPAGEEVGASGEVAPLVFCGINPRIPLRGRGRPLRQLAERFWRLLADARLTPRLLGPDDQWELLKLGYGLTNAAYRTTKGQLGSSPRRLHGVSRATRTDRSRAAARHDRFRRQGSR